MVGAKSSGNGMTSVRDPGEVGQAERARVRQGRAGFARFFFILAICLEFSSSQTE
jgi:hypothetical protein